MNIETSKQTVKVTQPPGGGSSNIFGDPEPKEAAQQHKQRFQASNIFGDAPPQDAPKVNANKPVDHSKDNIFGNAQDAPAASAKKPAEVEENDDPDAYLSPRARSLPPAARAYNIISNLNDEGGNSNEDDFKRSKGRGEKFTEVAISSYNPITGEAYGDAPLEKPAQKSRQPPGGASTGLW